MVSNGAGPVNQRAGSQPAQKQLSHNGAGPVNQRAGSQPAQKQLSHNGVGPVNQRAGSQPAQKQLSHNGVGPVNQRAGSQPAQKHLSHSHSNIARYHEACKHKIFLQIILFLPCSGPLRVTFPLELCGSSW